MKRVIEAMNKNIMIRERVTRFFLWITVISGGLTLGAMYFDLRVLVGAWSASPPESLTLLPYGPHYPVDTGDFFIPLSAVLMLASFGALIGGWKTPMRYKIFLLLTPLLVFAGLIFTVIAFWPRNAALWAIAKGSPNAIKDTTEILTMVHQWVTYDWIRIIMMMVGYAASIRAISIPFPQLIENVSTSLTMKIIYSVCIGIIFLFIAYFLSVIL